jgi:hypothetical protein
MMGKRMPWHSTQRAAWETHNKRGQMMTQLGRRALLLVVLLLKHARALQGLPAKILVSGSPFTEVREVRSPTVRSRLSQSRFTCRT